MKIIIDREDLEQVSKKLNCYHDMDLSAVDRHKSVYDAQSLIKELLEDHPRKTDGVLGVEIDEWPKYAPEDDVVINRIAIIEILDMLSKIHYELSYKEMRVQAKQLISKLASKTS